MTDVASKLRSAHCRVLVVIHEDTAALAYHVLAMVYLQQFMCNGVPSVVIVYHKK